MPGWPGLVLESRLARLGTLYFVSVNKIPPCRVDVLTGRELDVMILNFTHKLRGNGLSSYISRMDSDSSNVAFLFDRFCRYRRYLLRACCSPPCQRVLRRTRGRQQSRRSANSTKNSKNVFTSSIVLAAILITSRDN